MTKKSVTRRDFIGKTVTGVATVAVTGSIARATQPVLLPTIGSSAPTTGSTSDFLAVVIAAVTIKV